MMKTTRIVSLMVAGAAAYGGLAQIGERDVAEAADKPNILFIILDDVGVDQLKLFGYGGTPAARTPNLAKIAQQGVKFTNVWAMPECSPSRAAFFTGRWPVRTGVEAAIADATLPQSTVSPYEATIPRVLAKAGYVSALIGKYHLGEDPDPAGSCATARRGWHYFNGTALSGAASIDMTAGGADPSGGQLCGYFQTSDPGACYTQKNDGSTKCEAIDASNADANTSPARTCLQNGGLFRPNTACGDSVPAQADFDKSNGYYVWPHVRVLGPRDPDWVDKSGQACAQTTRRKYVTAHQEDKAADWWNQQTGARMLTVSLTGMHSPFQKAPADLVADRSDFTSTCNTSSPEHRLLNNILESMDVEIGRLFEDIGLATMDSERRKITSLKLKDTVVVIVGDNGSLAGTVRVTSGFDLTRSKATVYQTGVWVPLIVAGKIVQDPGRDVDAMINVTDLFQLFGDLAGIDVKEIVPPSHALDTQPMMPYLADTNAPEARKLNFTQVGLGKLNPDPDARSYPCLINDAVCTDTGFPKKDLCEGNGGTWFGPGGTTQYTSCCSVVAGNSSLSLLSLQEYAVRNKRYKYVQTVNTNCSSPLGVNDTKPFPWAEYNTTTKEELYDLRKTDANPNGLDLADGDFLKDCAEGDDPQTCLPLQLRPVYTQLSQAMSAIKSSADTQNTCRSLGDGNMDLRINRADIQGWKQHEGTGPSQFDINEDGQTDQADFDIIKANLGTDCIDICVRADLDRNRRIDDRDMVLLAKQTGSCDPVLCSGDLNGNGVVDQRDVNLMISAQSSCNVNGSTQAAVKLP